MTAPELTLVTDAGETHVLRLKGEFRVGRGPHNDLVVPSADVSWTHAAFRPIDGHVVVEDLGSRNGTWIDGRRIGRPEPVMGGCVVKIGELCFHIRGTRSVSGGPGGEVAWTPTHWKNAPADPRTLEVSLDPPRVSIRLDRRHHIVRSENRVSLLYFLALARVEDRAAGVAAERCGWRSDTDVCIAVWGQAGLDSSRSRLNTLNHRLRVELTGAGFDGLVEKRDGYARLVDLQVALD